MHLITLIKTLTTISYIGILDIFWLSLIYVDLYPDANLHRPCKGSDLDDVVVVKLCAVSHR